MPVDTSGNATRPPTPVPVTGQGADAPQVNVPIDDIYAILNLLSFLDGRKPMRGHQNFNNYRATGAGNAVGAQDLTTLAQVQALISAVQGVPTGRFVIASGMQVEPGYVAANGQTLSRTMFPALWAYAAASGNLAATEGAKTHGQYGPGDGSTTFSVPNLFADNGYFIRPLASGRTIGSVQVDELKGHDHTATFVGNDLPPHSHPGVMIVAGSTASITNGTGVTPGSVTPASAGKPSGAVTVNATGGSETRPKNIAFPVLIKT